MAASDSDLVLSISTDLATIKNQLKKFGDMVDQAGGRAAASFSKAGKSMDSGIGDGVTLVQRRINTLVGIADDASKQWKGALADMGSGFGKVESGAGELNKALKLNRAGMMELQAAGVNTFQALASGMGVMRVAEMEGAQVIGALVQGTEGGLAALGSKFAALGSSAVALAGGPIPAIGLALAAVGAAGTLAFLEIEEKAVSAEDALKAFRAEMDQLKKAAPDVAKSVQQIFESPESRNILIAGFKESASVLQASLTKTLSNLEDSLPRMTALHGLGEDYGAYRQILDLVDAAKKGSISVEDLRNKLADIYNESGTSEYIRDLAGKMLEGSTDARDLSSALEAAKAGIDGLGSIARDQIGDVDALNKALTALAGIAIPSLSAGEQIKASITSGNRAIGDATTAVGDEARRRLLLKAQAAQDRLDATLMPDGGAIPTPTQKPSLLDYDPNKTSGRHSGGGGSAPHLNALQRGSQSTDAQLQQLQARLGVLQSINPLLDDYGASMAEATKKQQLLSDAEKAGVQLSPTQLADIDKQAAAYGRMTGAVNEAQAAQDRLRQQMEDLRSTGKDVLGGFITDLEQGKSAAEALGDALQKVADKLLNSALDGLFNSKSAGGSDILGGLGSMLFGGGGGFTQTPGAGLFDSGGYTGAGGKHTPAGIVHKGEVVFSQSDVARHGGVAMVEALRRGYANGGPVAMPSVPSVVRRESGSISAPGHITVNVDGANGDRHVVSLVQQGVTQGLQSYDRQLTASFGSRMSRAQNRQV